MSKPPLTVLLTIDTELWPAIPGWPDRPLPAVRRGLDEELAADIHGLTRAGTYGLPYQLGYLQQYGLKANYFVESLFASCHAGAAEKLAHIVRLVQGAGHEVQLHAHTEWLGEIRHPALPQTASQFMCQLSLAQQAAVIRVGLDNLARAGVPQVAAFRAGSYGANLDTLRALEREGIGIDSSYNPSHLHSTWNGQPVLQPQRFGRVWEYPVASFHDWPGHARHAQLCAISFGEMQRALQKAHAAGWAAFVIVLHSFELVSRHGPQRLPTPNRIVLRRFEQLCALLASQPENYQTALFSALMPPSSAARPDPSPLRSPAVATLRRMLEQAWSHLS